MASVKLDADQRRVVAFAEGKGAVAAAAGSGKTGTLVERAVALVRDGAPADGVVTLVFNKNAEVTLKSRLENYPETKEAAPKMAYTFHALGAGIMRRINPNISVLAESASEAAKEQGRRRAQNEGPGGFVQQGGRGLIRPTTGTEELTANDIARRIWTDMGGFRKMAERPDYMKEVSLSDVTEAEKGVRERLFQYDWPGALAEPRNQRLLLERILALQVNNLSEDAAVALSIFMPRFQQAKVQANKVDFPDMLIGLGYALKQGNPIALQTLSRIRHLQVDEAQDGNFLRWYITGAIGKLATTRSVLTVGDLRQSIQGFAGAQPQLFKLWWDRADQQFALRYNYRSAPAIVAAGNAVAEGEDWNVGGDSLAARKDLGSGDIRIRDLGAATIAAQIEVALKEGASPKSVTVLSRIRAELDPLTAMLKAKGIKVAVRGGGGLVWKGVDGRHIRAYLNIAERRAPDRQILSTLLNRPLRYVSGRDVENWVSGDRISDGLYAEAGRGYRPAAAVVDAISDLSRLDWAQRCVQVQEWLLETLDTEHANNSEMPDRDSDRGALIKELCRQAGQAGSLAALEKLIDGEVLYRPDDPDVMVLSTIHSAKGDQWDVVYVTGIREGAFPSKKAATDEEFNEEVRLLYVAVTRPVHTLILDVNDAEQVRFERKLEALKKVARKFGGK
jgi:superfamily I DNA/RNA helicase